MALPAVPIVAAKLYSAYKTYKTATGAVDAASKLATAAKGASTVLGQVKAAVDTLDGGVTGRQQGGGKGPDIDMPKLAGLFPKNPGDAAPGMSHKENSFLQGVVASMIQSTQGMEGGSPQTPSQNTPSGPGM